MRIIGVLKLSDGSPSAAKTSNALSKMNVTLIIAFHFVENPFFKSGIIQGKSLTRGKKKRQARKPAAD